jgi:hypothetical protein
MEDACRQATRRTPGVAEDVAFIGRAVYLPMLMHQMSRDTGPDHTRGIIDDHLIGPYLLPLRLTGDIYLTFLQETLPELLQALPL